jgi:CDP-glycerol glycerophosphotransferase (TagB/SpsB family)
MLVKPSHAVLLRNRFKERVPQIPIIFNQPNFEDFQTYTGVSMNDVFISGVPFFDKYFKETPIAGNHLVYIDHPYYEEGFANWSLEHHRRIAESLFEFAERERVKLFIKLHPRSRRDLWERYEFNKEFVEVIQKGDYTELYLSAKLILGYSSSLINGFLCAKKNVVLLGWNPKPYIEGADFSLTGLCHTSMRIEDLATKYNYWLNQNLALNNEENYQKFLMKFNYPFDGKATDRIISILKNPSDREQLC